MDALVRCLHSRVTITEHIACTTEHNREADGTWWHNNEAGAYNDRLDVRCLDCGHKGTYWRGSRRQPEWLRVALDELGISSNCEDTRATPPAQADGEKVCVWRERNHFYFDCRNEMHAIAYHKCTQCGGKVVVK